MAGFENLERRTLADSVYLQLREAILGGDLAEGAELNQVSLAKQFDVSRVPVREALRRLQAEQLVTATPYQQYLVAGVSADALTELIDIREELEVIAVRRHIERGVSDAMVTKMRTVNGELRKQADAQLWLMGDLELHELFDVPGSETARMVLDVRSRIHRFLRTVASTKARRRDACAEHDDVIAAMVAKDADAAEQAMRAHIEHTRTMIVRYLAERTKQLDRG